jgi:hypothetical protein
MREIDAKVYFNPDRPSHSLSSHPPTAYTIQTSGTNLDAYKIKAWCKRSSCAGAQVKWNKLVRSLACCKMGAKQGHIAPTQLPISMLLCLESLGEEIEVCWWGIKLNGWGMPQGLRQASRFMITVRSFANTIRLIRCIPRITLIRCIPRMSVSPAYTSLNKSGSEQLQIQQLNHLCWMLTKLHTQIHNLLKAHTKMIFKS